MKSAALLIAALALGARAHAEPATLPDPAGTGEMCWRVSGPVLFCPPATAQAIRSDVFPNVFGFPDAEVTLQIEVTPAPRIPGTGWADMAAMANVADAKVTRAEVLTGAGFDLSDGGTGAQALTGPLPTWAFEQDGVSRRIYGLSSRVPLAPNVTLTTQGSRALPADPILLPDGTLGAQAFDIAVSHQMALYALRLDCPDAVTCAAVPLGVAE